MLGASPDPQAVLSPLLGSLAPPTAGLACIWSPRPHAFIGQADRHSSWAMKWGPGGGQALPPTSSR